VRSLLICVTLFICSLCSAQEFNAFTPIGSNEGLSDNEVRNITQLGDGRMVIITQGTVNIYNGSTFRYIHLNAQRFYNLPAYAGFHRSYVDGEGRLWIKNVHKLILVDMLKERFEPKADSVLASLGVNEPLADFFMDDTKSFWMVTAKGKLLYRNASTHQTKSFLNDVYLSANHADPVYDLAVLNQQLFLFYRSGIFKCYNLSNGKLAFSGNSLEKETADAFDHTVFVVPGNHTLYMLRNGKTGIMQAFDTKSRTWQTVLKPNYGLNCLSVNKNGDVFVSCSLGLWSFSANLSTRQFISTLHLVDGRTIDTEVSTLYNDPLEGFWIGTLNRGLLYYHPDRFKFRNVGKSRFAISKTGDLSVSCFGQNEDGRMLVGTWIGLFSYIAEQEKLIPYSGPLGKASCNAILCDSKKRVWVATSNGLYKLEGGKANFYNVGNIHSIIELENDEFYLGTETAGLVKFHPSIGTAELISTKTIDGKAVNTVRQIIHWKQYLLGISNSGMFMYDTQLSQSILSNQIPAKRVGMLDYNNHHYNCFYSDSRGLLWIGTQDGLNIWDDETGKLQRLYDSNGLVNNSIQAIIEDRRHNVWVSTSSGVSEVSVNKNSGHYQFTFSNFNTYDGVIDNEFIPRSAYVSQSNHLYLGGIDGFNELDLQRKSVNERKLKPLFVKLQLYGKDIEQGASYDGNQVLHQSITSTNELILDHDQNFLTLGFSALNYINPSQTYYQYYLEGVDKEWQNENAPDGLGNATYTNLSPGTYTLKVRAADNTKDWSGQIAQITITIKAPWWKTPWAIILYVLVVGVITYLVVKRNITRLKARQVKQQQEELDQLKFRFITNMSHELRTPLTLILTPLDVLLKRIEDIKLKAQLTGIYHNALNLLSLVNQLLDFRRLEISGETLHLSYCEIDEYVGQLGGPFEELARAKQINFKVDCKLNHTWLFIDKDKMSIMINNLLSNAFKFTPAGETIELKVEKGQFNGSGSEALRIQITDTGCGIAKKDLSAIFDRFYQADNQSAENTGSGIGLHLVREYARMHNGDVQVESEPGKGSIFTILIPTTLQPETQQSETQSIVGNQQTLKILIVEDNLEFREFLANQLSVDYTIITAMNGREGLEKTLEQLPDLVISDVMMPEMNGIDLCSQLKKNIRISHIPVILLTARSTDDARLEGYHAGADAYISKPFNMDILLLRIRNLIEQHEQRKDLFKKAIVIQPASVTTTDVDEKLIQSALKCVERNLDNTNYTVEHFSSDMNMDRTGLYRKLVATVGQSPSDFLRSVRLKNAAQLILQKAHSITDISAMVGFSNVAYFSKCFHDEYGVKPSQYVAHVAGKQ